METPALHNQEVLVHESNGMLRPKANGCCEDVAEGTALEFWMCVCALDCFSNKKWNQLSRHQADGTLAHKDTPLPRGQSNQGMQLVPRLMEFPVTASVVLAAKNTIHTTCSSVRNPNNGNNTTSLAFFPQKGWGVFHVSCTLLLKLIDGGKKSRKTSD